MLHAAATPFAAGMLLRVSDVRMYQAYVSILRITHNRCFYRDNAYR